MSLVKTKTKSYVLTLKLKTELWQAHILEKRFEIGRKIFMNVKDNRKEIDRHKCLERWDQFIRLHDEEIKRLHLHPCVVSSMGI